MSVVPMSSQVSNVCYRYCQPTHWEATRSLIRKGRSEVTSAQISSDSSSPSSLPSECAPTTRRRCPYTVRHVTSVSATNAACGRTALTEVTSMSEWRPCSRNRPSFVKWRCVCWILSTSGRLLTLSEVQACLHSSTLSYDCNMRGASTWCYGRISLVKYFMFAM